ncbi:hypothetical protein QUF76_01840 [Desulfobacterales bacterium HSG16]|nr:hypothetical protein [Desulfobacterales bacterium HSG16]
MKKINDYPYLTTSLVFLAIILFGHFFLHWQQEYFIFVLLLYFIVNIGIRLDDISRQIESFKNQVTISKQMGQYPADDRLNEVAASLVSIDRNLAVIIEKLECVEKSEIRSNVKKKT